MQSVAAAIFCLKYCHFNNLMTSASRPLKTGAAAFRQFSGRRERPYCGRVARGFTLFEVLVSILVLALGMLAAAGLQLSAVRTSQQSSIHTLAMTLASDMADRMRSNDVAMDLDDSSNPFLAVNFQADQDLIEPAAYCNLSTSNCTPAQLAAFEIYEWEKRLKEAMPTARAVICRDSTPYDTTTSSFKWSCAVSSTAGNNAPVTIKIGWQGKTASGKLDKLADGSFAPQIALIVAPYSR
jgi:type IV pilus assembly protein PilV